MIAVTSGFMGPREINTVVYDPAVIAPEEMVRALTAAGTYLGRIDEGARSGR